MCSASSRRVNNGSSRFRSSEIRYKFPYKLWLQLPDFVSQSWDMMIQCLKMSSHPIYKM
jgi:hypothetical protein